MSLIKLSRLGFSYYRSNSTSFTKSTKRFSSYLRDTLDRIYRLGLRKSLRLLSMETQCAQHGLFFQNSRNNDQPPWVLPDNFLACSISELPVHPLIEPRLLEKCAIGRAPAVSGASEALSILLSNQEHSECWNGIPLLNDENPVKPGARIAVCMHLFYPELWPILHQSLVNIPETWDLYISVPDFSCTSALAQIADEHPNCRFMACENRGRDVLPFLRMLRLGIFDQYDVVCKLHSKRSPHMSKGDVWLKSILDSLLADKHSVCKILSALRDNPELGLIGPEKLLCEPDSLRSTDCNYSIVTQVAKALDIPEKDLNAPFFAGTMFWVKPSALIRLRTCGLTTDDFPLEMAQTDGTTAHAIERLINPLLISSGYQIKPLLHPESVEQL